ncbi:TrmH family RNA methyltransferase [Sporosarcina ureilytica]|uniref:RNA methyltransferase n=1 Tax=Sporosarcina ureilytica TaxID=298596 RepID=A0A1D8JEZ9_9BACL|nr:RNA methyltransferase [Sporosarcina ureilytica]AOV07285.1 RNA methyltransferase [Sporosarcina ureilytica]
MKRIESIQNALVKHWKKLVQTRKERDKSKEFIVEGFHLVEEALKTENAVLTLMKREDVELPENWNIENVVVNEITRAVAKEISETEQSQGVYAHCRQPEYTEASYRNWKKLLFIDAVQDPGNVGTMIRTADAAGMSAVIIGKGSADPFNPKTVRSAQGSHFNIPVVRGDLTEWIQKAKENDIKVIGTSLEESVLYKEVQPSGKFALIVGNEGSGMSPELLAQTDTNVRIPIHGKAESLNVAVATGILLYAYSEE